jgi:hypothetical protein
MTTELPWMQGFAKGANVDRHHVLVKRTVLHRVAAVLAHDTLFTRRIVN